MSNVVPLNVGLLQALQARLADARTIAVAHQRDYMAEIAAAMIDAHRGGAGLDAIEAVAVQAVEDYRADMVAGALALTEAIRKVYAKEPT